MSLIKCSKCGHPYDDSYKTCPFCEEDEAYEKGSHRSGGGHRVLPSRTPRIVGPAMIVVVLLLAAVLVYTFFGSEIKNALRGNQADPGIESDIGGGEEELTVEVKPTAVELTQGDIRALTASGAESYFWSSSDASVATVSDEGVVTAHTVGTATVTVTDSEGRASAQCVVTVVDAAVGPQPGGEGSQTTPVDSSDLSLKTIFGDVAQYEGKYDLTITMRESFALEVEGAAGQVTWSTSDAKVVTVDSDGTLHPQGQGTAEVTATVGGKTLTCIVRVRW